MKTCAPLTLLIFILTGTSLPVGSAWAAKHSAIESIRKVAEQLGDPSAQYILGNMYSNGNKIEKDHKQARYWYEQAAAQGHTGAQARLGILLMEGPKELRDSGEARKWLTQAADNGHADAQHHLGELYRRGLGVKADSRTARKWYEKAAAQQHPNAHYRLGKLYENGDSVNKDLIEAKKWYLSARDLGSSAAERAMENLGRKSITPAVVQQTESSENDILQQNLAWAKTGDSKAMYRLGNLYSKGELTKKDMKKAAFWWSEAANKGHTEAQYDLALLYLQGIAVQKDEEEALIWLSMAAADGHSKAKQQLGKLDPMAIAPATEKTTQVKASPPVETKAAPKVDKKPPPELSLADKARSGDARAQYDLAMQLMADDSQKEQTVYWLERAASADLALAKYQLGNLYLRGKLVTADVDRGMLLMEEAARQGIAAARTAITNLKSAGYDQRIAAERGDALAQFDLAQQYLASSRNQDHTAAIEWLEKSAAQGHTPAMIHLGHLYINGEYTDQNPQQAFHWYAKAAENGDAEAQFQIAQMYSRGNGTSRSNALAARWYRMAARQNHIRAQEKLGGCLVCD